MNIYYIVCIYYITLSIHAYNKFICLNSMKFFTIIIKIKYTIQVKVNIINYFKC